MTVLQGDCHGRRPYEFVPRTRAAQVFRKTSQEQWHEPLSRSPLGIDLYKAGISLPDLELLDLATGRAKEDLDAINATLDHGQRRAELFFAQIESIKAGSAA
jgi:hypothetical protein